MSKLDQMGSQVALPEGLMSWMQGQGPKVWHAFARGVEFDHPDASIDVLMAAHWIARQPDLDRATGLLLLARAVSAGLLIYAPVAMDDAAARAFCLDLHHRLAMSTAKASLPVMPAEQAAIEALFDEEAPLRLQEVALRRGLVPCAFGFAANRPTIAAALMRRAA